jgi:hypothetical protein
MTDLSKMSVEQIRYEFRLPEVPVWQKAAVDELARRLAEAEAKHECCAHNAAGQDAETRHWKARAESAEAELTRWQDWALDMLRANRKAEGDK